jgi:hypothetical protein
MENPQSENQQEYLQMVEDAGEGLDDVAVGRATQNEIADKRYAKILAGGETIPWTEMKSTLVVRLESAHTPEKCDDYDARLHAKVAAAREQIGRGEYSSSESIEAAFAERRAHISSFAQKH